MACCEYLVTRINAFTDEVTKEINKVAKDGWRLVSLVADEDGMNWWTAVFEREVQPC